MADKYRIKRKLTTGYTDECITKYAEKDANGVDLSNATAKMHEHSNKALLDTYAQTEANLADAVAKKHEHSNKSVIDGITSEKVSGWDGKAETSDITSAISTHNSANDAHSDIRQSISDLSGASEKIANKVSSFTGPFADDTKYPSAKATQAFVNSSIQTATANFRGSWATWAAVPTDATQYPADASGEKTPSTNDYIVVADATGFDPAKKGSWRFKYAGLWATDGKNGWRAEYQVNDEPFTQAQLDAINSTITSGKVTSYDTHIADTAVHVTTAKKDEWDAKAETSDITTAVSNHNSANDAHSDIRTAVDGKATASDISTAVSTHNSASDAHSDIRTAVAGKAAPSDITSAISTHNSANDAHSDIRQLITDLTARVAELENNRVVGDLEASPEP